MGIPIEMAETPTWETLWRARADFLLARIAEERKVAAGMVVRVDTSRRGPFDDCTFTGGFDEMRVFSPQGRDVTDEYNWWAAQKAELRDPIALVKADAEREVVQGIIDAMYGSGLHLHSSPWNGCGDSCELKVADWVLAHMVLPYIAHSDFDARWFEL